MRGHPSILRASAATQHHSTPQVDCAATNFISGLLAIAILLVMIGAIVGYRNHRATVMQQRIKRLNRIWQRDANTKLA